MPRRSLSCSVRHFLSDSKIWYQAFGPFPSATLLGLTVVNSCYPILTVAFLAIARSILSSGSRELLSLTRKFYGRILADTRRTSVETGRYARLIVIFVVLLTDLNVLLPFEAPCLFR